MTHRTIYDKQDSDHTIWNSALDRSDNVLLCHAFCSVDIYSRKCVGYNPIFCLRVAKPKQRVGNSPSPQTIFYCLSFSRNSFVVYAQGLQQLGDNGNDLDCGYSLSLIQT